VFRPADVVETLECWDIALRTRSVPSLFALSRQAVPQLRLEAESENLSAKGAYAIRQYGDRPKPVLQLVEGVPRGWQEAPGR
jgi:transketolase